MEDYLLSICIPSFNRPIELERLLKSIDIKSKQEIQVVICEDNSPLRNIIRKTVLEFRSQSQIEIKYIENISNFGYDKNLRELILNANGQYVLFMGDDDMFVPYALDKYLHKLKENKQSGYILRSYRNIYKNGEVEDFRYFKGDKNFTSGIETYINLFNKSVFISGFCVKRTLSIPFMTDSLDGSLLFQLYLLAEICIRYQSSYFDFPLTQAIEGNSVPMFGCSDAEKDFYSPGSITIENSINFLKKYIEVIEFIDYKNNIQTKDIMLKIMSKYSYPSLAIQRGKRRNDYKIYVRELRKIGLNKSLYFEIYNLGLLILGKKGCDFIIRFIKRNLGRRPNL